jgi:tetratricopeptide (TPR) repeat protein
MKKILIIVAVLIIGVIIVVVVSRKKRVENLEISADAYIADSSFLDAHEALTKALAIKSNDTTLLYKRAFVGLELKKLNTLKEDISSLREIIGVNEKINFLEGALNYNSNNYTEAISFLERVETFRLLESFDMLSKSFQSLEKTEEEISALNKIIQLDSAYPYPYFRLGQINKDSFLLAIDYLNLALAKGYDSLSISKIRAGLYDSLNYFKDAILDYAIVYKNEKDTSVLSRKAELNYILKDFNSALLDYSELIEKNSSNPIYYYRRGNSFVGLKNFSQAISDFNMVMTLTPENLKAKYNRALSYMHLGSYEKAVGDFESLIMKKQDDNFFTSLGLCYIQTNQYDKANEILDKAISMNKSKSDNYYYKGMINSMQKQFQAAIIQYTNAINYDNKFAAAYYNRGVSKITTSDFKGGCSDFFEAEKLGMSMASKMIETYCSAFK